MTQGINIITPLIYDTSDGPYKTTKTLIDAAKQNIKVLFLTNPGERIMNAKYGIGIKKYLFENMSQSLMQVIHENIYDQFSRFLSYVKILELKTNFDSDKNLVKIFLIFSIDGLSQSNQLQFSVGN